MEGHEKYKCSCTERGSDVMKRSVQTRTFRDQLCRTMTSDDVDVEHFCEEEALGINCSGALWKQESPCDESSGLNHVLHSVL